MNKWQSDSFLYYQYLKDQNHNLKTNHFCEFAFTFILLLRHRKFVTQQRTNLNKIGVMLGLKKRLCAGLSFFHFPMDQRALNESNTFTDFFLLKLVLRCSSFVISEPKNVFFIPWDWDQVGIKLWEKHFI